MRVVCKGKTSGRSSETRKSSNLLEILVMDIIVCIESQQSEILRQSGGGVNFVI